MEQIKINVHITKHTFDSLLFDIKYRLREVFLKYPGYSKNIIGMFCYNQYKLKTAQK